MANPTLERIQAPGGMPLGGHPIDDSVCDNGWSLQRDYDNIYTDQVDVSVTWSDQADASGGWTDQSKNNLPCK